jgi:probable addiction module antidote protein
LIQRHFLGVFRFAQMALADVRSLTRASNNALGAIARSKGMTEIAKEAGLGRSSLYRALSPDGNPEFATVASVLKALGLRLSVARQRVSRRRATPRRRAPGTAIRKSA